MGIVLRKFTQMYSYENDYFLCFFILGIWRSSSVFAKWTSIGGY